MNKDIVALEGMEFYAFHGFYEEERKLGNHYTVDVRLTTNFEKASNDDDLQGTVNYVEVYEIVKEEMGVSTKLLERLAGRMIRRMFEKFDSVMLIEVVVAKQNPPIGGLTRHSKITMIRERS